MNARLAVRFVLGSRDGRIRLTLTALTSGLAVALLLLAVAIPGALAQRADRAEAVIPKTWVVDSTHRDLIAQLSFSAGDLSVNGVLLDPAGATTPPPGVDRLPAAGAMLVSPALARLLDHGDQPVVAARLPYRITGTIGAAGLLGPSDLRFVAVEPRLVATATGVAAVTGWGGPRATQAIDPSIALLLVVGVVVLLLPIGVVVVLSGRFGAERRERRLAALRLVGLGSRGVVRLLAMEASIAAVAGAVLGVVLFLAMRQLLAVVAVATLSVFPTDAVPPPPLAALVLLVVPIAVVVAAVAGLRGVIVEPLGVTRHSRSGPRHLWWRLMAVAAGAGLLAAVSSTFDADRASGVPLVAAGVALLLVGALAVLPWLVERLAAALPGGAVAWRLALGRLGSDASGSVRIVGVVAVTLAGAITLQMLFAGLAGIYSTAGPLVPPSVSVVGIHQRAAADVIRSLPEGATSVVSLDADVRGKKNHLVRVLVGDCAALADLTVVSSCVDGAVYRTAGDSFGTSGTRLDLGGRTWPVPTELRAAPAGRYPDGSTLTGALLVTPAAIDLDGTALVDLRSWTSAERLPALVASAVRADPTARIDSFDPGAAARRFDTVRLGLTVGLALVLALVGALLLTASFDQLRSRRASLAALGALGMRRRTVAASIVAESAVPVLIGAAVAVVAGLGLGLVLLSVLHVRPALDALVLVDILLAVAVPLALAVAGLPAAERLMRPEGLRAE